MWRSSAHRGRVAVWPGHLHYEGLMDELVIDNRDLTPEGLQELITK